jgi:hypothetical protein
VINNLGFFYLLNPDFATGACAVVAAEHALPFDLKNVNQKTAKQASQLQTEKPTLFNE